MRSFRPRALLKFSRTPLESTVSSFKRGAGAPASAVLTTANLPFTTRASSSTTSAKKKSDPHRASLILDEWTTAEEVAEKESDGNSELDGAKPVTEEVSQTEIPLAATASAAASSGTSSRPKGVPTPRLSEAQLKGKSIHNKRFYTDVSVQEATFTNEKGESEILSGKFTVSLDGKVLKTTDKNDLVLPNRELAELVKQDWEKQEKEILPDTMPFQALVCTALDQVRGSEDEWVSTLMPFLETDTICFPGGDQESFIQKQEALWTSTRDAFAKKYGVQIDVADGICLSSQPEETMQKIREVLENREEFSFWRLAAVNVATQNAKSLIVGMGVSSGDIASADQAVEIAYLEEIHQMSFWGEDASWAEKRKSIHMWLEACQTFYKLVPITA